MNINIKPLSKETKQDYLFFFDNMIFKENPDWSICYCYDYHFTGDLSTCTRDSNRSAVVELIEAGKQTGYLAYDNGKPVGWCSVNNRLNYKRLIRDCDLIDNPDDRVCSVVCFLIHPNYRRQGIAQKLLERILLDYAESDFDYIESYPKKAEQSSMSNFKGPLELYQRLDFKVHKEYEDYFIMRKALV